MSARNICFKVVNRIRLMSLVVKPKGGFNALQVAIIERLVIRKQPTLIKRGMWCKWDKPSPGWFKLNVDGSARGETTTGGGVIRNHHGELLAAFSSFYGLGTNNSAEFGALK